MPHLTVCILLYMPHLTVCASSDTPQEESKKYLDATFVPKLEEKKVIYYYIVCS